jgi:hypothetical protein
MLVLSAARADFMASVSDDEGWFAARPASEIEVRAFWRDGAFFNHHLVDLDERIKILAEPSRFPKLHAARNAGGWAIGCRAIVLA